MSPEPPSSSTTIRNTTPMDQTSDSAESTETPSPTPQPSFNSTLSTLFGPTAPTLAKKTSYHTQRMATYSCHISFLKACRDHSFIPKPRNVPPKSSQKPPHSYSLRDSATTGTSTAKARRSTMIAYESSNNSSHQNTSRNSSTSTLRSPPTPTDSTSSPTRRSSQLSSQNTTPPSSHPTPPYPPWTSLLPRSTDPS